MPPSRSRSRTRQLLAPVLSLLFPFGLPAAAPDEDATPHVVLIGGDAEYSSRDTVLEVSGKLRDRFGFRTTVLLSRVGVLEGQENPNKSIPGLEALDDADLLILYVRMRIPPEEDLRRIREYFESGRPAIGLRTTTHAFTNDRGFAPRYFGGHYWSHFGGETEEYTLPSADEHPVLRGLPRQAPLDNSLYLTIPLSDTATPLVLGRRDTVTPPQAYAWVNEYKPGSRQFFSTMSDPEDIAHPYNQTLLYNAIFWALEREVPPGGVLELGEEARRPQPEVSVPSPPASTPLEGAIALFEGDDLSAWDAWFGGKEGARVYELDERAHSGEGLQDFDGARWRVEDGAAVAVPGYGDIMTREEFTDYRLHLDFLVPPSPPDAGRIWRGNSGVYLGGSYEVQILDAPSGDPSPTSCGAILDAEAPAANACREAGVWQSLDVLYRAPRFRGDRKVSPARMTVVLNGEEIHSNVAVTGPTPWGLPEERREIEAGPLPGPIRLQADSGPVRFANIWLEPLADEEVARHLPHRPPATGKPWIDMDYGQFLTSTLQVGEENIVHKGISIRLDGHEGGVTAGTEFMVFDTDTLRWGAGWTSPDFIDWRSIVWDGSHQTHPSIVGQPVFRNPPGPGWARPGSSSFEDPRITGRDGVHYGPLDDDWAHWKGLYVHGEDVVLSYRVGDTDVLEVPDARSANGTRGFIRTVHLGPRPHDLRMQVAHDPDARLEMQPSGIERTGTPEIAVFRPPEPEAEPGPESGPRQPRELGFDGTKAYVLKGSDDFDLTGRDFTIAARIRTHEGGTIFAKAPREGNWVPNGKTLFVRDGRLAFDIGWVGVVSSERRIDDGEWHDVTATFDHDKGLVALWIDGDRVARSELAPHDPVESHVVKIGYTSTDFPENRSAFAGDMAALAFWQRRLSRDEIRSFPDQVAGDRLLARFDGSGRNRQGLSDLSGNGRDARAVKVSEEAPSTLAPDGRVLTVGALGGPPGLSWERSEAGDLRLVVPAGDEDTTFEIAYVRVPEAEPTGRATGFLEELDRPRDPEALTHGGPRRWRIEPETRVEALGRTGGPFEVDVITLPMENPYRSWMRPGGFDFFDDGDRAAVCTWNGDVWIVEGLSGELDSFRWKRIASGLFQPLGLVIADGAIYVLGRDQITRLHDRNGDGEADFYENFNNDAQVTEHFHEFAMALQRDADGNFYYTKGGRHALDAVVPQHGTLLEVSPDGRSTEILATGFRAPNGLCLNEDGTFIVSDQEGHWTPANRINWVRPGGFYGYRWAYTHPERSEGYDGPLVWVDHDIDRSPGAQLWVESKKWKALDGKLLSLSYGTGKTLLVLHEEVGGVVQGGVTPLPIPVFPTGIMRGRFHPRDGQLWTCGLFGWSSERTYPGGFYRIRRTEQTLRVPVELRSTEKGVLLGFSTPLDPRRAQRAGSYRVERWDYNWRPQYGSEDYRVSDGEPGRERVKVTGVRLSSDHRRVFLEMPGIRPAMQQRIDWRLRAANGRRLSGSIWHTMHVLGKAEPLLEELAEGAANDTSLAPGKDATDRSSTQR